MKPTTYRQCELRRGDSTHVAWLPIRFAVQGEIVRIRTDDGWDDGWLVAVAYDATKDVSDIDAQNRCYRWGREAVAHTTLD